MPKNEVTDPITDQEMVFARLILAGTMNDRQAAVAAGLTAESAAYIKSKPRVRAYMLEHRAKQEADLSRRAEDEQQRKNITRERVLTRLWELAVLNPEVTRGSATAQMKALSLIIALEELIPDRKAQKLVAQPVVSAPSSVATPEAPAKPDSSPSPAFNLEIKQPYAPHPATVKSQAPDLAAAFL